LETTTRATRPWSSLTIACVFASRLQRDLVGRRQAVGEQRERLRGRGDLTGLTDQPVLPDRHLREVAMHIQADAPPRHALTSTG